MISSKTYLKFKKSGIFGLKCVLIEFAILNLSLSLIFIFILEIFKISV